MDKRRISISLIIPTYRRVEDLNRCLNSVQKTGLLAHLVERVTLNHRVGGSSPSQPT